MPQDYDAAYKAFDERLFQRWQLPVEVSRQADYDDIRQQN